ASPGADPLLLCAGRRPAGLHELYRLVQQVLEETPRTSPRVATHLPAHCRIGDREWHGTVLSLSENGCLLRTAEVPGLGTRLDVSFSLPRSGVLRLHSEVPSPPVPPLGLVFNATPPPPPDPSRPHAP